MKAPPENPTTVEFDAWAYNQLKEYILDVCADTSMQGEKRAAFEQVASIIDGVLEVQRPRRKR